VIYLFYSCLFDLGTLLVYTLFTYRCIPSVLCCVGICCRFYVPSAVSFLVARLLVLLLRFVIALLLCVRRCSFGLLPLVRFCCLRLPPFLPLRSAASAGLPAARSAALRYCSPLRYVGSTLLYGCRYCRWILFMIWVFVLILLFIVLRLLVALFLRLFISVLLIVRDSVLGCSLDSDSVSVVAGLSLRSILILFILPLPGLLRYRVCDFLVICLRFVSLLIPLRYVAAVAI